MTPVLRLAIEPGAPLAGIHRAAIKAAVRAAWAARDTPTDEVLLRLPGVPLADVYRVIGELAASLDASGILTGPPTGAGIAHGYTIGFTPHPRGPDGR